MGADYKLAETVDRKLNGVWEVDMRTQIKDYLLRLLLCFGSAFLTVILLRAAIYRSTIAQSLAEAFVIAMSIALGLAWIERPHPR